MKQDVAFTKLTVVIAINPEFNTAIGSVVAPEHVNKAIGFVSSGL